MSHSYYEVFIHPSKESSISQVGKFLNFKVDSYSEVLRLKSEWSDHYVEHYKNSTVPLYGELSENEIEEEEL